MANSVIAQATSMEQKLKHSVPSPNLPKGCGVIREKGGKFAADLFSGMGSLTVTILISPGRSGFGWNLSLPQITCQDDIGLLKFLVGQGATPDSVVFILSGGKDMLSHFEKDEHSNLAPDDNKPESNDKAGILNGKTHMRRFHPRIERWSSSTEPTDGHWRPISRDNILTLYGAEMSDLALSLQTINNVSSAGSLFSKKCLKEAGHILAVGKHSGTERSARRNRWALRSSCALTSNAPAYFIRPVLIRPCAPEPDGYSQAGFIYLSSLPMRVKQP